MHVSMAQEQVNPPTPPNLDAVPAPHPTYAPEGRELGHDGDILAAIHDAEENESFFEQEGDESDQDVAGAGGAGSTTAEATAAVFPAVTFHDLQHFDPADKAFDFNTRVFKRKKLQVLAFDEKGTARLLVWCVVNLGRETLII